MAPSPMKRKSASPSSPRKAKRCQAVVRALDKAENIPKSVRNLLGGMAEKSLGVVKESRHPYQVEVVNNIGQTLAGIAAGMRASVAETQAKVDGADQEKASRVRTEAAAVAALAGLKADVAAKSQWLETCEAAHEEAKAAQKAALKAQKSGDADVDKVEAKKARLDAAQASALALLKGHASGNKEGKAALKTLVGVGKEYGIDTTMVAALPMAFSKAPEARVEFDNVTIHQFETALANASAGLAAEVQAGAPAKAARAGAVGATQQALDQAKAAEKEAEVNKDHAKEQEAAGKKAVKAAERAVSQFLPDMEELMDGLDDLKSSHAEFTSVTLVTFQELKERVEPPPEPEQPEEPEASPEAAPVTADGY